MADNQHESNISEKERDSSVNEERDQDTSRLSVVNAEDASRPTSTRSAITPASLQSNNSARSSAKKKKKATKKAEESAEKGGKGKAKKGKKHKVDEDRQVTPVVDVEDAGLPEGAIPIFLSSKTQEIFECVAFEHVTEAEPFKVLLKEKILADLFNRAAISDFHPIKQIINDYPGDEILIGYDADFKHGQNFYIATTEEAKEKLLRGNESAAETDHEMEEEVFHQYIPPVPKDWISLGSEREIEEEGMVDSRSLMKMVVRRLRRDFGAPCTFEDRDPSKVKDAYIECSSYEDNTYDLTKIELVKATQAVAATCDNSTQTNWRYPRNANTQYVPREFDDETLNNVLNSEDLETFLKNVVPRFDLALQQNEITDIFFDDWQALADDDAGFGAKADNHLKEYQSFTDLQFSKNKTITGIDWHPTNRGVIAVSVAERMTFDERIDNAAIIVIKPSLILIWNFSDPIHPQLLLEAPEDICCFKFCPTDTNIVAGGCINGQLVLWDISEHAERLKAPRASSKNKAHKPLQGFDEENPLATPIIRYCAVSSIEFSHTAPITDLLWVPDHMEVTRMGVPQENRSNQCVQIITCATDSSVLFWDIRPPKAGHTVKEAPVNPMGVPNTFRHLNLQWKPHLKVSLPKTEPGGDHSPCKFSIQEKQGDRSALDDLPEEPTIMEDSTSLSGGFTGLPQKPASAMKRTLKKVTTNLFVGTEDGEIVYVDWMPQKDQDTGKTQTMKAHFYSSYHDGPIVTLQRSPFFKDIILCIGGWSFSIWKEGVYSGPILSSAPSSKRLTTGHWSPSRPAIFYIGKQDGSVDVWDLLDRTHEASMNQSITQASITCLVPHVINKKQHLLAICDASGTLHILEIPWSLRKATSNELQGVSNYFEREVKRRAFVVERWDMREREKIEKEAEAKRVAGIAPQVMQTEEEINMRLQLEYNAFLEEEQAFLKELGLKEEPDEEDGMM